MWALYNTTTLIIETISEQPFLRVPLGFSQREYDPSEVLSVKRDSKFERDFSVATIPIDVLTQKERAAFANKNYFAQAAYWVSGLGRYSSSNPVVNSRGLKYIDGSKMVLVYFWNQAVLNALDGSGIGDTDFLFCQRYAEALQRGAANIQTPLQFARAINQFPDDPDGAYGWVSIDGNFTNLNLERAIRIIDLIDNFNNLNPFWEDED